MLNPSLKPVTTQRNEDFVEDTCDFFGQRRAGHMSKWLYSTPQYEGDKACGANDFGTAIAKAKMGSPYYVFLKEQEVIQSFASKSHDLFSGDTHFIDLGPGSADATEQKVFPLLKENLSYISQYVAVDICPETASAATKRIEKKFPKIKTILHKKDFVADSFYYSDDACKQQTAAIFGLTLCNMPIDPRVEKLPKLLLTSHLKRLGSHFSVPEAYLFITQDTNQDIASLKPAYMALEEHYKSVLHLIARDLNVAGDYNPGKFFMDVEYFPETQACALSFVAMESMLFAIEGNSFSILKGDRFYFHNAFKFDEKTMIKAANMAGYDVVRSEHTGQNPCILHVLKRTNPLQ